ncbi:MAG: glycerol-3-phosphate acyltransferase [Caldisericia bacterium]|jgi:glycerol-3-phosphate acyltransferase PlsY|nr:glycerol-3-phosphate acyltransferase [Caldisericia bacterium]
MRVIDFILITLSYFIGSLTSGIILAKLIKKEDIRNKDFPGGSGAVRQYGIGFGSLVGLLDILKGAFIAFLVISFSKNEITIILSYIFLILGNNYPIYFGFRGGQGVGATIGFALTLFPFETLISFLVGSLFAILYKFLKLNRLIKFMGAVPFGAVFGLITMFIILSRKYPFYPFPLLVIIAGILLLFRGLQVILFQKKRMR